MTLKTIKGVREEKWAELKSMAAKSRVPMGKFLENIIDEHKKKDAENFWDKILHGEKILSDKEAEDMHNLVKEFRKEKGFRI